MSQSRTLFLGMDGHKDTMAVVTSIHSSVRFNRRSMDCIQYHVGPMLVRQPVAFAGTVIVHQAG
jgi:hypothetical protein